MKRNSRGILSIIVVAILSLSFLLPLISVHAAIAAPAVTPGPWYVGDVVWVNGSAGEITSGAQVSAYWDYVSGPNAWLLNSTTANPDGSYEMQITVPEAPTGTHYIWVKDVETGATAQETGGEPVWPMLEVSPTSGLPDDDVTLTGKGFAESSGFNASFFNSTDVFPIVEDNAEETDEYGSFEITVTVPSPLDYGMYWFNITDDTTSNVTDAFKVGTSITLTPDEGPEGSVVTIKGRGFEAYSLNETDITWDGWGLLQIVDDSIDIESDGSFTGKIIVPSWGTGEWEVIANDGIVQSANASFTIDGETALDVTPTFGSPGSTITVTGYNFTQIDDTEVTLDLNGTAIGTVDTNADGYFTTTFIVPAIAFDQYVVNATTADYVNTTKGFKVGIIAVIISPISGDTGTEVTLTGTGFEPGDYNATLGDMMVIEGGTVSGAETLSDTFYVPTMDPGTYNLVVEDTADNEFAVTFTVTETTSLTATPDEAAVGYNISLHGQHFAHENATELTWYVFNSTWSMDISDGVNISDSDTNVYLSDDGNFTGYWTVVDELLLGNTYTINATDNTAALEPTWAETNITIVEEEVEIGPYMDSYSLGDTITFRIKATFPKIGAYLEIVDPEETLYFSSTFGSGDWSYIEPWRVVQIRNQVDDVSGYPYIIPTDAMIGTWVWSLYDSDDEVIMNGTIEVLPTTAAQVDSRLTDVESSLSDLADEVAQVSTDIEDEIAGLSDEIAGVKDDLDAVKSDLASDIAEAKASADAAAAAVGDLEDTVSDIAATANSAKAAADSAKASADAAKDAADDAKTATSGLTTLVYGAIGASLIAALAAIVSLMQISRRIAG